MKRARSALGWLGSIVFLAGCHTARPLYYWGHYEPMTYQSYTAPEKMGPERQIEILREDLQKAAAEHLSVSPGVHAHLGYLLTQLGKLDEAAREFETEKQLFPESATFIDRLINQQKAVVR